MFKRLYVSIILRNLIIFMILLPILNHYAVSMTNRVPNIQKEKILTHIYETGSTSVLDNPILSEYNYFYIDVNTYGEILEVSPSNIEPTERERYIDFIINIFFSRGYLSPKFVSPDDESINHRSNGLYFYSAKIAELENQEKYRIMVLYTPEFAGTFRETLNVLNKLNIILLPFICGLSLLFTFFEVKPIEKAKKEQKEFFENASHELRTPITVMSSVLGRVNDGRIEEQGQWLEILSSETAKARQLVNDIMLIVRADSKHMKLKKNFFRLDILLLENYISMEVAAMEKGVAFSDFQCKELVIYGDSEKLGQLTSILLKNAIENTDKGGNVLLTCHAERTMAVISIKDTGKGIEKRDLKKIFRRFYRVDPYADNGGSVGLGLSIAEWIVKLHKGKIIVKSKLGQGSTFIVKIPLN